MIAKMFAAAAAFALLAAPVLAQDADALPTPGGDGLPRICSTEMDHSMHMAEPPPMDLSAMSEDYRAMFATMEPMHLNMMLGMAAKDIDVAFICGMIPHHQGAIDMARVVLKYGDDPFAKELATKVIEAQEAEIAQMTEWLNQLTPVAVTPPPAAPATGGSAPARELGYAASTVDAAFIGQLKDAIGVYDDAGGEMHHGDPQRGAALMEQANQMFAALCGPKGFDKPFDCTYAFGLRLPSLD